MSVYSKPCLPLETIGTIITFVDDLDDLRECALVCRAWAPLSQQQLFRDICISLEPYSSEVSETPTGRLNIVFETSPNLAQFVRRLQVGYTDGIDNDIPPSHEQQLLSRMIQTFAHLNELVLLCDGYLPNPFEFDASLLEAFRSIVSSPRLRHLEINGWIFRDIPHLLSLTGTSINSTLTTLVLGNIEFDEFPLTTLESDRAGPPVLLNSLTVGLPHEEVDAWLNSLSHPLAVKRLCINAIWTDVPWATQFQVELEELYLSVPVRTIRADSNERPDSISIDFGDMSNLSKITLHFCQANWLHFLLHTLPANNTLKTLELLYIHAWGGEWRVQTLRFLDEFLTVQRFPHFTTLLFNYQDHEVDFEAGFIQKGLGKLIVRGVVHIYSDRKGDILLSSELHEL